MYVSDNFVRADGALGPNWLVIPNKAESTGWGGTPLGNVLIKNNGAGPDATNGADCCAIWNGSQTFGTNQWAEATIKTVAGPTATLSITAVSFAAGNSTYTYTVTAGSIAANISEGHVCVLVSGMQNAGNNGAFNPTSFGAGTFTVANGAGVTESGSSGTGFCPSDSGAGVGVWFRGSTAGTLNGYFFHVGTNSFGGAGRKFYYEMWKVVNGSGTIFMASQEQVLAVTSPVPGDTIGISAIVTPQGNVVTAYYNGHVLTGGDPAYGNGGVYQFTDAAVPVGGRPAMWSFAISGPNEYDFASWSAGSVQFGGNNGTTINNFRAGDVVNMGNLFVQGAAGAGGNGGTVAFPSNNKAGNILVTQQLFSNSFADPGVPTDSQGNTWFACPTIAVANGNTTRLNYCVNCKGGPNTVTYPAQAGGISFCQIAEFAGSPAVGFDSAPAGTANAAATSIFTSLQTISSGNVLVIANLFCSGSTIPNAGAVVGVTPNQLFAPFPNTFIIASAAGPGGSYGAGFSVSVADQNSISMLSFNNLPATSIGGGDLGPGYDFKFRM